VAAWSADEVLLREEVLAFCEAERMVARRYFAGEDLLFPRSLQTLREVLALLDVLGDVYRTVTGRRPPESEEGFLRWVLEEPADTSPTPPALTPGPAAETQTETTRRAARSLAECHVILAKAEALEALGERNVGVRLVEGWVRSRE